MNASVKTGGVGRPIVTATLANHLPHIVTLDRLGNAVKEPQALIQSGYHLRGGRVSQRANIPVPAKRQYSHKYRAADPFTSIRIYVSQHIAGKIDHKYLPGLVFKVHTGLPQLLMPRQAFTELGITVAIRALADIFLP